MTGPEVLTFEQFAARNGASRLNYGEAGLHNPAGHMPASTWKRMLAVQVARDEALTARRDALRAEYDRLVAAGEIRPPTSEEVLAAAASGEGTAAEAARRVLEKRRARREAAERGLGL